MCACAFLFYNDHARAVKLSNTVSHCSRVQLGLVWFLLTSRSTILLSCWDGATASWVFTSTFGRLKYMFLTQGHYTAVVRFEPWTSRSGDRRSTTFQLLVPESVFSSHEPSGSQGELIVYPSPMLRRPSSGS